MTTQTCQVMVRYELRGRTSIRKFNLTCTDGQWNDLTTATGGLGLGNALEGAKILDLWGTYTAGIGIACIRDSSNKQFEGTRIKLNLVGSEDPHGNKGWFRSPRRIQQTDRLSVYCLAVPT